MGKTPRTRGHVEVGGIGIVVVGIMRVRSRVRRGNNAKGK